MTFLPECGAGSIKKDFSLFNWMHNDFMYVRFGGMRNTKIWSKSRLWYEGLGVLRLLCSYHLLR